MNNQNGIWVSVDNLNLKHPVYKPKLHEEDRLELDHYEYGVVTINLNKVTTIVDFKDEYAITLDDGQVIMVNEETYLGLMDILGMKSDEESE